MDFEYNFKGIDKLRCDIDGNFNYNNTPIKKQWREGQIFIKIYNKRYGMKTLRKLAFKVKMEILFF
jgi:hypothetical protein